MKLAIMQPYLFPYIGYFQLIHAVDKIIMYDDVNFIKQGWINRNRILIANQVKYITVPLKNSSSFISINNVLISNNAQQNWKSKWMKTIAQSYGKASQFKQVFPLVESVITQNLDLISELAICSIKAICDYLEIKSLISDTSSIYSNNQLKAAKRVLDICERESCCEYINALGGRELYSKKDFELRNIRLQFIKPNEINYRQFTDTFVPWLSIIDVIMHNSKEEVKLFLTDYQLI